MVASDAVALSLEMTKHQAKLSPGRCGSTKGMRSIVENKKEAWKNFLLAEHGDFIRDRITS